MARSDDDAAQAAIVRRFQEVAANYHESQARQKFHTGQVEHEQKLQEGFVAVANDCHAAARLLGFDLIAALATFNKAEANAVIHSPPPQQVIAPVKPIADVVLDM